MEILHDFRDDFTCSLSKRVLKRRFLESGLTKIFTVCNFGTILPMTIIFSFKMFVFQIIAFELGVGNSHNLEQDTCRRQSICSETSLTFHLTLGETYSKSTSLRMIKEHDKTTLLEISKAGGMLSHVYCRSLF